MRARRRSWKGAATKVVLVCLAACAHSADTADDDTPADASDDGVAVDRGEAAVDDDAGRGANEASDDSPGDSVAEGDAAADAGPIVDADAAVTDASDAATVDAGACGGATVLVHRGKDASGARVMTTSGVFPAGFTEDASFRVFPQASGSDTKPLYQLYSSSYGDYLPSLSQTEGNPSYQLTDTIGQMYVAPQPGMILLTRYVQVSPQKHLASTNAGDVPSTFYAEGAMGYVCPP